MSASDASVRTGSGRPRWILLIGLVVVCVVALVAAGVGLFSNTSEGGPVQRVEALQDPPADPMLEREQMLGLARDFVVGFNTYGPDMLTEDGAMPDYAALSSMMTAKFGTVFDQNVAVAEQTVVETSVQRSAEVHAVAIASADEDSAELLVAGTARFAYPDPENEGEIVEFDPERFRYQVSLVNQRGEWLVDDLDDLDDDLPSFADSTPAEIPTDGASPSPSESPSQPRDDRKRDGGEDQ